MSEGWAYQNGNCRVTLHPDGTKVREWEGIADPERPESVDLKITDYCDAGCPWCHERSTVRGDHADTDDVCRIVAGMIPGSEIAIGGGNPLDHPELLEILTYARTKGCVPNLTVNARHLDSHHEALERARPLIGGLGISYSRSLDDMIVAVADDNTVVHLIAGVDSPATVTNLAGEGVRKFLILGYKDFGRGARFRPEKHGLARWRYFLPSLLSDERLTISFDNLGLEQLQVRELVGEQVWAEHFMGEDGQFTMYVDAVRWEFAVSSTSPRRPIEGRSIAEMFAAVRGLE